MPELPEVEHFRQILLPLVSSSSQIIFECPPPLPIKRFPTQDTFDLINQGQYAMKDVLRKGKLICIILQKDTKFSTKKKRRSTTKSKSIAKDKSEDDDTVSITGNEPVLYLSLHMGMTGRISSPTHIPELVELKNDSTYPPPHTHLIIKSSNGEEAAFSDPRRFGSVLVDIGENKEAICKDDISGFKELAPDALDLSNKQQTIVDQLINRKKGIKGLLLDQKAVVSGVGNWVADEILYRCNIHPDQSYLNKTEAQNIVNEMHHILSTAVDCLNDNKDLPEEWLFHRRWRGGGGGSTAKDYNGKAIKFIQSGGRSSAIIPSLQKLMGRKSTKKTTAKGKKQSNKTSNVKKIKAVASKKPDTKGKRKRVDDESSKGKAQSRRSKRLAAS